MKRRHSREQAIELAGRLRSVRPDIALGADIIAGFPTETEAAFENSRALISDCNIAFLHAFPYSPRPGTPAARMPQLPKSVITARAAELREAGQSALIKHLEAHQGRETEILVERGRQGRLSDFTPVAFEQDSGESGRPVRARITGHDSTRLKATAL
jgi:threonylcarbamoyladenosine tRNA methylthiotransferase MtaB